MKLLHYLESSEIYNRTSRAEINEKIQEIPEIILLHKHKPLLFCSRTLTETSHIRLLKVNFLAAEIFIWYQKQALQARVSKFMQAYSSCMPHLCTVEDKIPQLYLLAFLKFLISKFFQTPQFFLTAHKI